MKVTFSSLFSDSYNFIKNHFIYFFSIILIASILQTGLTDYFSPTQAELMAFLQEFNIKNINDLNEVMMQVQSFSINEQNQFAYGLIALYKASFWIKIIFYLGSTALIIALIAAIAHGQKNAGYIIKKTVVVVTQIVLLLLMFAIAASIIFMFIPSLDLLVFLVILFYFFKTAFEVQLIAEDKPKFFACLKSGFTFLRRNVRFFLILFLYFIVTFLLSLVLNVENFLTSIIGITVQLFLYTYIYCFLYRLYDRLNHKPEESGLELNNDTRN